MSKSLKTKRRQAEKNNPHTPYARRRRGTARRASGLGRCMEAAL